MRRAPEIPLTPPSAVEDVTDYVLQIHRHINSQPISDVLVDEMTANLEIYSAPLFSEREVVVSGLHKIAEPDDDFEARFFLTSGITEGTSLGFSICEIDALEPDSGDEEQMKLFEELVERNKDRFVISYLINRHKIYLPNPDHSVANLKHFNVVAPVRANDILIKDLQIGEVESSPGEVMAILSTASAQSKKYVSEIAEALKDNNPLQGVLNATPAINSFVAQNSEIYNQALNDFLSFTVPDQLVEKVYKCKSLPPVMYESEDGEWLAGPFRTTPSQIGIENLYIRERYLLDESGNAVKDKNGSLGIFLAATISTDPWGGTFKFLIPAEYIEIDGDSVQFSPPK
jgi:hypothetical protein